ncbi:hypothetical protein Hanom_Chr14g01318181 [Helianthus anomalus]
MELELSWVVGFTGNVAAVMVVRRGRRRKRVRVVCGDAITGSVGGYGGSRFGLVWFLKCVVLYICLESEFTFVRCWFVVKNVVGGF